MPDPDVVLDDEQSIENSQEQDEERRSRRRLWPLAIIILLLLLMCCVVTSVEVYTTGGPEQARFVARNLECLQCHTELIPEFSKPVVHNPFLHKECTVCHTPHGSRITATISEGSTKTWQRYSTYIQWLPLKWMFSLYQGSDGVKSQTKGGVISSSTKDVKGGTSTLVAEGDDLCWICHGDIGKLLDDPYQHKPFKSGECLSCHSPHSSDYKGLLTTAPNRICLTCHPIGDELSRKQVHPPAGQGWCIDCHNPHASKYKGILIEEQRKLCFSCHPEVSGMAGLAVQHQPFEYGNCTGCHQPHGSDYVPLLNRQQPDLCYQCHPDVRNQFRQPSHHPVQVNLSCGDCHQPHATQFQWLLVASDNTLCYGCHGEKESTYEASAHSVNACISCHTPHGSRYAPLLVQRNPELCLSCHPVFGQNPGKNHPVSPEFYDVHADKGLTCTSSCHDPHGTEYNYMLKNFFYPQDGMCLQCHSYVGITY